jgi:hypothetical protein
MRLSPPHDHGGSPCLPTHHPQSHRGWPRSVMSTRCDQPNHRTCSPPWPPSLTQGSAPGAATHFLVTVKQADYLFTVKANQPTLLDRCAGLPWHQVPMLDRTRDQAHGRVEIRTLKAVTVGGFGFPHTAQVLQVTRKTRNLRTNGVAHHNRLRRHQPHLRPGQPRPARRSAARALGESRTACTTCGMSPSPRTPPRSGPGPPRRSWRPCATWPSACCAAPGRSTSPPRSAITAATPTDPWPPSASAWDATKHCQGHRALRFPVTCTHVAERPLSPGPRQAILEGRPGADDDRCRKLLGAGYPCDQPVADEGLRGPRRLTLADLDQ